MNKAEHLLLTTALSGLKGNLCAVDGAVVITGSQGDREAVAGCLSTLDRLAAIGAGDGPVTTTDQLQDAILQAGEELSRLEGHDPQHHVWLDHLRELLEIQASRLRAPDSRQFFRWSGEVHGGEDFGLIEVHVGRPPASEGQPDKTDRQVLDEAHAAAAGDAAAPADDVVDAEFPPTFIDFTSLPSKEGRRLACHDLLRRVVSNARTGPYNAKRARWDVVQDLTGLGSTFSAQLCQHFGFDPDQGV